MTGQGRRRVLLGQLASNGDCLYATAIARQIKVDDPSCHLTWAIGSPWRSVIRNNPHVDDVWEVPVASRSELSNAWRAFENEARDRKLAGEFDDVYFTQIAPNNYAHYDGTVRASIFRGYPRPITVPITPVVRLVPEEREAAESFIQRHGLREASPAILFEVGPRSGQSFVTTDWAMDVARRIRTELPEAVSILSSSDSVSAEAGIVDGSCLKFRENVVLTEVARLVVGCSSGITWLCTSDAARPLPTVQFLRREAGNYGAVVHDFEYWGLPSNHVVEVDECSPAVAAGCIVTTLRDGPTAARQAFGRSQELSFSAYDQLMLNLLLRGELSTVASSLRYAVQRYGLNRRLLGGFGSALREATARRVRYWVGARANRDRR